MQIGMEQLGNLNPHSGWPGVFEPPPRYLDQQAWIHATLEEKRCLDAVGNGQPKHRMIDFLRSTYIENVFQCILSKTNGAQYVLDVRERFVVFILERLRHTPIWQNAHLS
ncbi:hypothetical protein KCU88_g5918, partial [Aureobasidium melanogenum]